MVFTQEDYKKIGNNISYIRKAYGYKTQLDFALALDPNGHYPRLSHDMIKKYESGKNLSEGTIRLIGAITGFTVNEIVKSDLSTLEPNSLSFDDPVKTLSSDDSKEELKELVEIFFPIEKEYELMSNSFFKNAIEKCEKFDLLTGDYNREFQEIIMLFEKSNSSLGLLNILSMLGRFYFVFTTCALPLETLKELEAEEFDSTLDYLKRLNHIRGYEKNAKFINEFKSAFLEDFNNDLSKYMYNVAKDNKYKDFVYYYLGVRYYIGLMDNKITKMTDEEMNVFGFNMLECLDIIGNKYAKEFIKAIKE